MNRVNWMPSIRITFYPIDFEKTSVKIIMNRLGKKKFREPWMVGGTRTIESVW